MRIAPRALLCATAFRVHADISGGLFEELRELCSAPGDKASLAIGMAGLVGVHLICGRVGEASRLASEHMALIESIGDPTSTVGLSMLAIAIKFQTGEIAEALRWSQTVIELADREPANGALIFNSPLPLALATRGTARWALGRGVAQRPRPGAGQGPQHRPDGLCPGHHIQLRSRDRRGVLLADDGVLRDIKGALASAERASDDLALGHARFTLGIALVHRDSPAERERAAAVLGQVRDMCLHGGFHLSLLAVVDMCTARERARSGDRDGAIPLCVKSSTTCSMQDSSGLAFGRPPFWWRRCWSVVPGMTWPKPRPRSTGWRPRQPTTDWLSAKSGCCGCGHCWPRHTATTPPTATIGIATARWPLSLASRAT